MSPGRTLPSSADKTTPPPLSLDIAGVRVSLDFPPGPFRERAVRRYSPFLTCRRPEYVLKTGFVPGRPRPFRPSLEEAGGELKLRRGDFDCSLDLRRGRGRLELAPRVQAFDSFLRVLYSRLLPDRGGLLVHGACLEKGGRAYLFPGVSGAGKSTLSKLAAAAGKARVLSDELAPVRLFGGRFYAYGSPFWGEMKPGREARRYPLAGVYGLEKAREDGLLPAAHGALLRLLLRCAMNFSSGPAQAGSLLALCARLSAEKGRGRFRFSKAGSGCLDLL